MRFATKCFFVWTLASLLAVPLGMQVRGQEEVNKEKANASPLKSVKEKVSYGIGLNIGRDVTREQLDLNIELPIQGIRDAASDGEPKLSQEEFQAAMAKFQQEMAQQDQARRAQEAEQRAEVAAANKAKGQQFLAKNKQRKGVKTTKSGLQYEVIKSGDGDSPTAQDTVRTHYEGKLIDGTVFDSSVQRQEPVEFPVSGVIKGWTEALQLMQVGDKWRLFIPAELAYGERGAGNAIGPNETLIFEVELLDVLDQNQQQ